MDEKPLPGLSISDHSKRIESLIDWLESKDINVNSSRIPTYKKFLDSFMKIQELNPAKNDEDQKIMDKLLYVLREVHELIVDSKRY